MGHLGTVPVVVFAYARHDLLEQLFERLRAERIPLMYVFCDGPRTPADQANTDAVRRLVRAVQWCETRVLERSENLGLGASVLSGVTHVLERHPAAIVFEDDLAFSPGTYRFFCDGLERYRDDERVLSLTGWSHERVRPSVSAPLYFDGRAECWSFATWSRAWRGMDQTAASLYLQCRLRGIDVYRYGADLVAMARAEAHRNIWAVRWSYLHLLRGGLCLRPSQSLVNHIGFDTSATNAPASEHWLNATLPSRAPEPGVWPPVTEAPDCSRLWQRAVGTRPPAFRRALDDASVAFSSLRRLRRVGLAGR